MHGGDFSAARRCSPTRPNLSSISRPGSIPNPTPCRSFPPDRYARLPERGRPCGAQEVAANAYGAPSADHVVAGPGSQILLAADGVSAGAPAAPRSWRRPTRSTRARPSLPAITWSRSPASASSPSPALPLSSIPTTPMDASSSRDALLAIADRLRPRGGLLLVDEAFMDVAPVRRERRRPDRARQHRGAALVRQVLRARGLATELRARLAGNSRTHRRGAWGPGRSLARLSPWGGPHWPTPIGGKRRAVCWPKPSSGSRRCLPTRDWRSSAAHFCSGWCGPRMRRSCSSGSVRRGSSCGASPTIHPGCFGLPGNEAEWQRLGAALAAPV